MQSSAEAMEHRSACIPLLGADRSRFLVADKRLWKGIGLRYLVLPCQLVCVGIVGNKRIRFSHDRFIPVLGSYLLLFALYLRLFLRFGAFLVFFLFPVGFPFQIILVQSVLSRLFLPHFLRIAVSLNQFEETCGRFAVIFILCLFRFVTVQFAL